MVTPISITKSYMLAAAVPLLRDRELCEFLRTMDEVETKELDAEDQSLNARIAALDQRDSYMDIFLKAICASLGFGALIGGHGYVSAIKGRTEFNESTCFYSASMRDTAETARARHNRDEEQRMQRTISSAKESGITLGFFVGIIYILDRFSIYRNNKKILIDQLSSEVNTHRILRLQDKTSKIGGRLTQEVVEEKEQLDHARNYFGQRQVEMQNSKANLIEAVHYHV